MTTYINPMNDLGPALQGIAETVATVIDPNYKFKKTMRDKLATDPDLIKRLSSVEDSAPGTLEAMGFGKQLTSIIRKTPIPEKDLIEKLTRPQVEQAAKTPKLAENRATQAVTGQPPGGVKTDTFKGELAQSGTEALQNPQTREVAGTAAATGARPFQLQSEQAGMETTSSANAWLQKNPDATVPSITQGFLEGKIPASVISGLYNIPSFGEALKAAIGVQLDTMRTEASLRVGLARTAAQANDATYRMKYGKYVPIATQIGANPDAVIAYMDNSEIRARADKLAANPGSAKTPEEQELVQISQGVSQLNQQARQRQLRDSAFDLQKLIAAQKSNENNGNDEGTRLALLQSIQENLDSRSVFGMPKLTVHYGKVPGHRSITDPFGGAERIYFTGKNGKVVDENIAVSPTLQLDPELKSKVDKVFINYNKMSDTNARSEALRNLKKSDPELYNALITNYDIQQ